jgi:hypothetical protein
MADWKQITARIRRARTSKDPAGQLSNLYEKTQDAMVAFELARHFETAGLNGEAGKWYALAAGRFRRADWKAKAAESAARLGVAVPVEPAGGEQGDAPAGNRASPTAADESVVLEAPAFALTVPEAGQPLMQTAEMFESVVAMSSEVQAATEGEPAPAASSAEGKRRRRGRRGGRNRRKSPASGSAAAGGTPTGEPAAISSTQAPPHRESARTSSRGGHFSTRRPVEQAAEEPPALAVRRAVPPLPVEASPDFSGPSVKGRYGDPGLSSRLNLLEMQFRRLLTCEPAKLDDTVLAPVGPGVFLLSDSDLTSYYYVEACQTLRVAIGNLLRGGSSKRGAESIKPQLAEHLGIPETRVTKYLAEHCVVRWLQLDEGASHFAHFVIAVLRPTLNE